MTATVTKGKILRSDLAPWDGRGPLASRKDSTGGTIAGLKVGTEVDVLLVYGDSVNYTRGTISDCVRSIGSTSCTLVFSPGTWTIDDDLTIASNFTSRIPAGAIFNVSSGKTLTFSGPVIRDSNTWTSGSGTVTESGTRAFSGAETHSGTETHTGTESHSGTETHTGAESHSGAVTHTGTINVTGATFTNPAAVRALLGAVTDSMDLISNASWSVSVAANAITIALKTKAGTDPSATDPVLVSFRKSPITDGGYVVRTVTSALSLVISAGSTLGFSSSMKGRIYVGFIDNSGTVELCAWNPQLTGGGLSIKSEQSLQSTTAEGGAGGADSASTIYSTTARTSVAFRYGAYFDIQTSATAGNWSNAPTVIQPIGPKTPITGDIISSLRSAVVASTTGTTVVPFDNTEPQDTEGDSYASPVSTPQGWANLIRISSRFVVSNTAAGHITIALFNSVSANALTASTTKLTAANDVAVLEIDHLLVARDMNGGGAPGIGETYSIRIGNSAAGTTRVNGSAGAALFNPTGGGLIGGRPNSWYQVDEIQT